MNKDILTNEFELFVKTLDQIQEEQSVVKRKLSELLEAAVLNEFVDWAEDLLQQILNRETALLLLRKDILAYKKWVLTKKGIAIYVDLSQNKQFKKFKDQVLYLETEFYQWKQIADKKFELSQINPT
jgi:hypothetical protein